MEDKRSGLQACLQCGNPGLGDKDIICAQCAAGLFGNSNGPISFCKKCQASRLMDETERKAAEKDAGVALANVKGKIMLVLDSCPNCYQDGDSTLGQFAVLKEMPVQ